jgi:hypothetical protein
MLKHLLIGLVVIFSVMSVFAEEIDKYTNKNEVTIKGTSDSNVQVTIYVNDKQVQTIQTDDAGAWYAENVPLPKDGVNTVYAVASADDGTRSKGSVRLTVMVDKNPPRIQQLLVEPKTVKPGESIKISLKTDADVLEVPVVMPDNSTIKLDAPRSKGGIWTGSWTVPRLIAGGAYQLVLMPTDRAGNMTEERSDDITIDSQGLLTIISPQEGDVVYDPMITIKGMARNSAYIMVNEDKTVIDQDGTFTAYTRLEQPGRNAISIKSFMPGGVNGEKTLNVIRLITFRDIKRHWARQPVEYLATLGYVQAYPQTDIFAPDQNISRAELAALLVRTKQYPLSGGAYLKPSFRDVGSSYWAMSYIETASKYGLIVGYPGHLYRPQNLVTRAEAAAMFVRFANTPVMNVERSGDLDVGMKHWASSYIAAFKAAGLMPPEWRNTQRFFPNRPITRAEICAIMARIPEINREIELLIDKKTNWDYAIDNSYYVRQPMQDTLGYQNQTNDSPAVAETPQDAKSIIVGIASPREVMAGNDLSMSVATLVKMKQVEAIFPDTAQLPLQYNNETDLWELNWKVPKDQRPGNYSVRIEAVDQSNKKFVSQSNPFTVFSDEDMMRSKQPTRETYAVPTERSEYAYPEEQNVAPTAVEDQPLTSTPVRAVAAPAENKPAKAGTLTRGMMTELLARHGKLRRGKVNGAPAKDVAVDHPQASTIKSAIVTGVVPNVAPGKFSPSKQVTKAEAKAVLKRLKITKNIPATQEPVTEKEFDGWLTK